MNAGNPNTEHPEGTPVDVAGYVDSFAASLEARGLSAQTIKSYLAACDQLRDHLQHVHQVTGIAQVTAGHVEGFLSRLLRERSPATAANRFRSLRVFFGFCVDRGFLDVSPISGLKPPRVPMSDVPVLHREDLDRLLATCSGGTEFQEVRDHAILRLFVTTGARRSEVAGLSIDSIDLREGAVRFVGKGSRERVVSLDCRTADAVRKYLCMRTGLRPAGHDAMWVAADGRALSGWGVDQMARRRAKQAGIEGFHLHVLRHSFANLALANGMSEGDLMRVAGWSSRSMLDRYGRANAQRRANAAHRDLMDRIGL